MEIILFLLLSGRKFGVFTLPEMSATSHASRGFLTVCYYSWDQYGLRPSDIDTTLCTHLVLGFLEVEDSLLSKGSTEGETSYEAVASLKNNNPSLKVMASVGGGANSHGFHSMVSDASKTDRCHHLYPFIFLSFCLLNMRIIFLTFQSLLRFCCFFYLKVCSIGC